MGGGAGASSLKAFLISIDDVTASKVCLLPSLPSRKRLVMLDRKEGEVDQGRLGSVQS